MYQQETLDKNPTVMALYQFEVLRTPFMECMIL